MQLFIVDGRLGRDAEVKVAQSGDKYLKFSLANRVYRNGEEDTVWYDVISYDAKFTDKLSEHLKKGSYVIVTGHLNVSTRIADGKVYTNLVVRPNSIEFGGGGKKNEDENATTAVAATPAPQTVVSSEPQTLVNPTAVATTPSDVPTSVSLSDDGEDDLPF